MHVLILSQYYPPEIGAPQSRLSALAKVLLGHGHQVTVLTAMPNYPQGRVYPGYDGLIRKDLIDGVQIIRTAIYASSSVRILPRLASYFSFVISSMLLGIREVHHPDIVFTESPPLFLGISGYVISRWKRAKWVFNVSDLWPKSAYHLGYAQKHTIGYRLSKQLEAFCYRQAWIVTGQSRGILANINGQFPRVKTHLLSNGVDIELFRPVEPPGELRSRLAADGKFLLVYAGLHGIAQGLEQIILAARILGDDCQIVLIGDGPEKQALQALSREFGLNNVKFMAPIPYMDVPMYLSSSDAALVMLKTELPGAIPSKLYEAMAVGKPVLLVAEGEAGEIVNQNRAGIVVKPGDIDGLVRAIRTLQGQPGLCRQYGSNGRMAAVHSFNLEKILLEFVSTLEKAYEKQRS